MARRLRSWLIVLPLLACAPLHACATEPVAFDGCKAIEEARCKAIVSCPGYEDLDVNGCVRFYRDQCLHGMAASEEPGKPRLDQCVRTIQTAGACAARGETSCVFDSPTSLSPCEVIEHPEQVQECNFIVDLPATPDQDAAVDAPTEVAPPEAITGQLGMVNRE